VSSQRVVLKLFRLSQDNEMFHSIIVRDKNAMHFVSLVER
jgi:hypothetical protein